MHFKNVTFCFLKLRTHWTRQILHTIPSRRKLLVYERNSQSNKKREGGAQKIAEAGRSEMHCGIASCPKPILDKMNRASTLSENLDLEHYLHGDWWCFTRALEHKFMESKPIELIQSTALLAP